MSEQTTLQNRNAKIFIQIILILISCFFIFFGIQVLVFAFTLNHPGDFILTFFASNLIILISLALLTGFVFKIIRLTRFTEKRH